MMATYLSAVLALLLLWNVYPKDFNYGAAAGNGLLFYNANVRSLPPSLPDLLQQWCSACGRLTVPPQFTRLPALHVSCVSFVVTAPGAVSPAS